MLAGLACPAHAAAKAAGELICARTNFGLVPSQLGRAFAEIDEATPVTPEVYAGLVTRAAVLFAEDVARLGLAGGNWLFAYSPIVGALRLMDVAGLKASAPGSPALQWPHGDDFGEILDLCATPARELDAIFLPTPHGRDISDGTRRFLDHVAMIGLLSWQGLDWVATPPIENGARVEEILPFVQAGLDDALTAIIAESSVWSEEDALD